MPIRELLSAEGLFAEPLVLLSTDGIIDTANQPFANELGLPLDGLPGRRIDALAAASATAIQEYLRACAQSAKVVRGSFPLRRRADTVEMQARGIAYPPARTPSVSQVLLRLVVQKTAAGNEAAGSDARHWREVEESLRRQSQILEVTLASIGDAVMATDTQGRVTFLNSVAEHLTGWPAQSARGRPLKDIFHIINEHTRKPADDPVAQVLETGAIVGLANHTILIARDGREIPIGDSAAPIRLPDGKLFGVVLVFRDVTETRRAEINRAWLAAIVESSDDAIVSKTLDGRITSWNPGAARLFGYAPDAIIGKHIMTIVPPELHAEEEEVLARLRRGERIEHFETTRIARDGRRIEVSLTVSPIRDEEGNIIGASKVARDISERKQSERMLREVERRKDEFLAVLAHELRNPLAPMRNALELLRKQPSGHEVAHEIMDRQLRQMTRLVDDLLDISRVAEGRIHLEIEAIEMQRLLRTVEDSLRPAFEASDQRFVFNAPAEPLHVHGDRVRLLQVFSNLVLNANKYTPRGGSVSVNLERDQDDVVVRVIDTGVGIPAGMLDEIFEIFAQVDPTHQHARTGLGIGLTLARRLVELHGGRIEARSEGPDKGSEFTVRLPSCRPPVENGET
jgi:PAS domain S-box-containing protein